MSETSLIIALAILNLLAGAAIAVPIANRLRRERSVRFLWCYVACLGVYVTECVAFAMEMATQVCTPGATTGLSSSVVRTVIIGSP